MRLPTFIFGVDLGEVRDFTGIAALRVRFDQVRKKPEYMLGVLERHNAAHKEGLAAHAMPGRDFYEIVGAHLLAQVDDPRLPYHQSITGVPPAIAVDGTGSGREAAMRFLRGRLSRVASLFPIQIRPGDVKSGQRESGFIQVSRRDLLTTLACVLDAGRFRHVDGLPLWKDFERESLSAEIKETRGRVDPSAGPRLAKNDDLVFAVGMPVFVCERLAQQGLGGYVPVRYG